ncbi:MAG: hypothetical protein ACETWM_13800 [Candidatus Lokiarchaeia archaeon]
MLYEKIIGRLNQLIEMGKKVLLSRQVMGGIKAPVILVNGELFYHWQASSLSFLKMVFGDEKTHFQEFHERCTVNMHSKATIGQGILKAAKEDIEGGYLKRLETLVAADIFTDFLEMAEHLVEQGYKDPAAMLVGAVLEDGLRKIAKNNGIALKSREDIGSLNNKIVNAKIYGRIIQKKVYVWNEIRNNSDHAKFDKYTLDYVKEMLNGVRDFLKQYLRNKYAKF